MAVRGETIGTAYVRILADGSGMDDSVRDEMRSHGDAWEGAGEESSENFWKGYNKQHEKNAETSIEQTIKTFDKSRGRWATLGELSGSDFMDGVREALSESLPGGIGDQIGKNLSEGLESGAISGTAGIRSRLSNIAPEITKATKQIQDEQVNQWRIGYNEINRETETGMRRVQQTIRQGGAHADLVKALFGESERDTRDMTDKLVQTLGKLKLAVEDYDNQLLKGRGTRRQFRSDLVNLVEAMPQAVRGTAAFQREVSRLLGVLDPAGSRLARWREQVVKSGEATGRLFGKGSRNDFLNLFGSMISILPRAAGAFGKATESLAGFGRAFNELRQSEGIMSALGASLSALGKSVPGILISVGTAIGSIATLLPAFGAAISLVTGAVLALAGSLGFALVGALGAVAGAVLPFAAGLGVAALAISGLPDKSPALDSLKKTFDDLKKTASEGVFGKDGAGLANLEPILKSVEPLVDGVSKALGGLLDQLGKIGQSKAFTEMMSGLTAMLPGLVTQLGSIGGNLALGIGQAFVALGPIIQEFLGWLDGISAKFVAFGAGGKDSGLAKFFNDAWASAKIVGGLISNIIALIGQLFSAGKGTGDSMFQGIADKVQEIVTWLSKPEGQKALAQWFADAQKLGEKLGDVVVQVVAFVDALDTPASRQFVMDLVDGFGRLIGVLTAIAPLFTGVVSVMNGVYSASLKVIGFFMGLPAAISGAVAAIGAWASGAIAAISGFVSGAVSAVGNFFSVTIPAYLTGLQGRWTAFWSSLANLVVTAFQALPGLLANVGFAILQAFVGVFVFFQTLPLRILGYFIDFGPRVVKAMGDIVGAFRTWVSGLPAAAKTVAGQIGTAFQNLGKNMITKAGNIASAFGSWVQSLPGKAKTLATQIGAAMSGLGKNMIAKAGNLASAFASWVSSVPGKAKALAKDIAAAFSGLAKDALKKAGSLPGAIADWGSSVASAAGKVADKIVGAFSGLASRIVRSIGTVVPNWALPKALRKAAGGIISSPVVSWVGEEGPEAIIPLNRNLSRVDPAVRALSAIAQGLPIPAGSAIPPGLEGAGGGGGMNVTIITPTEDPRAVAAEVFARFAAASYV